LVIDIGGRSTEFIIGKHFTTETTDSLRVGSVAWSLKYFADGQFSERNFQRAEIAAESFLDMVADTYQHKHWDVAYGASGTVGAVADILECAGFGTDIVTQEGLTWLRNQLIKAKHVSNLELAGLKEERKAVIAGGLTILIAVFDILKLDHLVVAKGALRHGLLYDMIAEDDETEDLRDASIYRLTARFGANKTQASNVSKVALRFFDLLSPSLHVPEDDMHDITQHRQILGWAAYCHEIGCAISHSETQRHGAYILDNTELMGFAQSELHRLSLLVLGHYGKLRKLDANFEDEVFICQILALRLAVIFCHSRNMPVLKNLQLSREGYRFMLSLPSAWQKAFPQTCYLLEEEVLAWQKTNWTFIISSSD
jgi:exopolyphosphatase/guanosine-5'-triphosphate,3'-diphosphate pyrophosphatase